MGISPEAALTTLACAFAQRQRRTGRTDILIPKHRSPRSRLTDSGRRTERPVSRPASRDSKRGRLGPISPAAIDNWQSRGDNLLVHEPGTYRPSDAESSE